MTTLTTRKDQQGLEAFKSLAKVASESKQYGQLTEVQLLNLMLSARDYGISPMKAINGSFYIVSGKVCMSTVLMADRIRKAGHSIKVLEMTANKCVILGKRADNEDSLKLEYTWEDATLAGLVASPSWKKYPKNMLYNRCMSQVARVLFPDVVGNAYSEEERFDIQNVKPQDRPLENLDADVEIAASVGLGQEEADALEVMIDKINDAAYIKKLQEHLGVNHLFAIQPKDFQKVMRSMEKKLEEVSNGSDIAE